MSQTVYVVLFNNSVYWGVWPLPYSIQNIWLGYEDLDAELWTCPFSLSACIALTMTVCWHIQIDCYLICHHITIKVVHTKICMFNIVCLLHFQPMCTNTCFWYIPPCLRGQVEDKEWWQKLGKVSVSYMCIVNYVYSLIFHDCWNEHLYCYFMEWSIFLKWGSMLDNFIQISAMHGLLYNLTWQNGCVFSHQTTSRSQCRNQSSCLAMWNTATT